MKKWFLTKLVFRILVSNETKSQFDIQLRLVQAKNADEAFHLAKQIGFSEEEVFPSKKKKVEWKFIDVESVNELPEWKNGMELCSMTHEDDSPEEFIQSVKSKSAFLHLQVADTFVEF